MNDEQTLYVVEEGQYSDRDLIAVMATFEMAKNAVKQHIEQRNALMLADRPDRTGYAYTDTWEHYPASKYRSRSYWVYEGDGVSYSIYEMVLDEIPKARDW